MLSPPGSRAACFERNGIGLCSSDRDTNGGASHCVPSRWTHHLNLRRFRGICLRPTSRSRRSQAPVSRWLEICSLFAPTPGTIRVVRNSETQCGVLSGMRDQSTPGSAHMSAGTVSQRMWYCCRTAFTTGGCARKMWATCCARRTLVSYGCPATADDRVTVELSRRPNTSCEGNQEPLALRRSGRLAIPMSPATELRSFSKMCGRLEASHRVHDPAESLGPAIDMPCV